MAKIGQLCGLFILALVSSTAVAGGNGPVMSVPTLDELALFGLAAAVGAAGVFALLRRRK